ncbi:metalloendopeptidase, partial [Branchiostoma belcheri]
QPPKAWKTPVGSGDRRETADGDLPVVNLKGGELRRHLGFVCRSLVEARTNVGRQLERVEIGQIETNSPDSFKNHLHDLGYKVRRRNGRQAQPSLPLASFRCDPRCLVDAKDYPSAPESVKTTRRAPVGRADRHEHRIFRLLRPLLFKLARVFKSLVCCERAVIGRGGRKGEAPGSSTTQADGRKDLRADTEARERRPAGKAWAHVPLTLEYCLGGGNKIRTGKKDADNEAGRACCYFTTTCGSKRGKDSSEDAYEGTTLARHPQEFMHPEEFEIVAPHLLDVHGNYLSHDWHGRRPPPGSTNQDAGAFHVKLRGHGQDFHVVLEPNHKLLAPGFAVHRRRKNKPTEIEKYDQSRHCHFHGKLLSHGSSSSAALSTCGGLKGVLRTPEQDYFIEPLHPEMARRKNFTTLGSGPHTQGSVPHPHVLYKRSASRPPKASKLHRHQRRGHRQHYCGRKKKYYPKPVEEPILLSDEFIHASERSKRSLYRLEKLNKERNVETLVVVDKKMLEKHGNENITTYVLTILNMGLKVGLLTTTPRKNSLKTPQTNKWHFQCSLRKQSRPSGSDTCRNVERVVPGTGLVHWHFLSGNRYLSADDRQGNMGLRAWSASSSSAS